MNLGLFALICLVAAFLAGFYVASALGLVALLLGPIASGRYIQEVTGQIAWTVTNSYSLVSIPLFILMGELLVHSGITERVYRSLSLWLDRIPGGLLHTNIAACTVFAAVSGSSAATAATIGSVALPAFRERGYNERLVLGSIAAGGTLGIMIPPSINLIVYGVLMEVSVGQLYMAGIVPGLFSALLYMLVILVIGLLWPRLAPRGPGSSWGERLRSLVSMIPILTLILLVLGTIYLGVATPTEAAAFGVTGAFVLALLHGGINLSVLKEVSLSTARTTSLILLLLIAGFVLQFVLSLLGIPQTMAEQVTAYELSKYEVLAVLILFYLVLGAFMETFAIMVTTLPIVLPILTALDINLIWFAIIAVKLTEIGQITPPYGLNLFILHGLRQRYYDGDKARGTIGDLYIGQLPFLAMDTIALAVIVGFPALSLWLPGLLAASK